MGHPYNASQLSHESLNPWLKLSWSYDSNLQCTYNYESENFPDILDKNTEEHIAKLYVFKSCKSTLDLSPNKYSKLGQSEVLALAEVCI